MINMPIPIHCVASEPCPNGGFIDKDHLIKWISDVLEQAGQDKNLAIAYLIDLREWLSE